MSNPANDQDRASTPEDEPVQIEVNAGALGTTSPETASHSPREDAEILSGNDDDLLEACLERLAEAGPFDDPEQLRALLPSHESGAQCFVLLELIKLDMALHAEIGRVPSLETYIDAFPELLTMDSIPVDLVLEEIQLRKESGEHPTREDYQGRFPQFDSMIAHLLRGAEATAAIGKLRKPPELEIGGEIDDFAIIKKLGEGAFAHVFLARQISMQRLVALKVSTGTGDEPQALAQLDHPNIVRVFDQRSLDKPPAHLLYMQYHPGGTLAEVVLSVQQASGNKLEGRLLLETVDRSLLRSAQVLPDRSSVRHWIETAEWPTVVAWLGVQLASALQEAHQLGMLHRDVKPANVLLTAEGIPKLADFNVSFAGAAGRAGAAASFGGSLGYMAPEHLRAITATAMEEPAQVGKEADVYSLAILLWELWQGNRPFPANAMPLSWSDLVAQQLASRSNPLTEPKRCGTASERVLEKTLRFALQHDVEKRPSDAAEMAGRLKLAMHPEAANLLDPAEQTLRGWIAKRSPWIVAGIVILLPNVAAGLLNYEYNISEIKMTGQMRESLAYLAKWVNAIVYPLGVFLMVIYTRGLVRAIQSTRLGRRVTSEELDDTLDLGHRAALIGGSCWIGAGFVYTAILMSMYADFTSIQATHFFMSMLICGGVAMVYPMFGMALLVTFVYYPMLVRGTMRDDGFDRRHHRIIRRCESYLLVAAIIPLLGAALLISSESESRAFMLVAIGAGALGLVASFFAYRFIVRTWSRFSEVLSNKTAVIPVQNK